MCDDTSPLFIKPTPLTMKLGEKEAPLNPGLPKSSEAGRCFHPFLPSKRAASGRYRWLWHSVEQHTSTSFVRIQKEYKHTNLTTLYNQTNGRIQKQYLGLLGLLGSWPVLVLVPTPLPSPRSEPPLRPAAPCRLQKLQNTSSF